MNILMWFDLALTMVEKLLPHLNAAFKKGEITVEQQNALYARIEALDPRKNPSFSSPEWKPSNLPPS